MTARKTFAAVILALSTGVNAAPLLDQSYDADSSSFIVGDRLDLAQTFTVGMTGTLTGLAVELRNICPTSANCTQPQVPLVVDVRRTVAGTPVEANSGADILGSALLPWTSSPFGSAFVWVDFDLPDFAVTAGDLLAIVLRAPGSGLAEPYLWTGDHGLSFAPTPGTYSGGREFLQLAGGVWGG